MIKDVFLNELLRHKRSNFQWLLMTVVCLLLVATALVHWQQQVTLTKAQEHWQETSDQLWASQPNRHPHRVAHYGHVVVRPLAPLSFIEPGVGPYTGNYLFLEAHRQNSSAVQSSALNPATLKLGFPSVSSLIVIFWPLLLIVLGFGAFSNEWDTGRLYWLSSFGASVWQLFLGKVAVLALYTALLLVVVFFISLLLLSMQGILSLALLANLLMLLGALGFYSLFWMGLVLTVSFYSRDSHQSLWRLLTLWLILVVLLPKISLGLAQLCYPTPDRANFDAALEKAVHQVGDSHNPNDPYFNAFRAEVLDRYGVKTVAQLPVNWNGLVMAEGERVVSDIFQKHYQTVMSQFAAQDTLNGWFGFLSPVITLRSLVQRFTHTDRSSADHFERTAEAFRVDLIQRLNHLHSHEIEAENDKAQKLSSDVWKNMALFNYVPPHSPALGATLSLSLALWVAVVVALFYAFRKRQVYL